MKKLVMLLGLMSLSAFAGKEVGNGGDVLKCKSHAGDSYILLDVLEGKLIRGYSYDETSPSMSALEATSQKIIELKKVDVYLAKKIEHYATKIAKDIDLYLSSNITKGLVSDFVEYELPDVSDSFESMIPKNCVKLQAAVQSKTGNMTRFAFDGRIIKQLPVLQIMYLVMHEAIYELFLEAGSLNSIQARVLNGFIISNALLGLSKEKWLKETLYLDEFDFGYFVYNGTPYQRSLIRARSNNPTIIELSTNIGVFRDIYNDSYYYKVFYRRETALDLSDLSKPITLSDTWSRSFDFQFSEHEKGCESLLRAKLPIEMCWKKSEKFKSTFYRMTYFDRSPWSYDERKNTVEIKQSLSANFIAPWKGNQKTTVATFGTPFELVVSLELNNRRFNPTSLLSFKLEPVDPSKVFWKDINVIKN